MSELLQGKEVIVFDLGNVVIDLHYHRTANQLAELAGLRPEDLGDLLVTSDVLQRFEVGAIDEPTFRREMCDLLKISLSDDAFDAIWNALLGEISAARMEKIRSLQAHYRTMVLSNTNIIHERSFNQFIQQHFGYTDLTEVVDRVFLSHQIGKRKPNEDIYLQLLEEAAVAPERVLFIDDRQDNVEAAQKVGIHAFQNKNIDDWLEML